MSKILILLTFLLSLSLISSKWEVELIPRNEYEIENPFPFNFEEKCKFIYENPSDKITIKILKGKLFSEQGELSNGENGILIDNKNQKKIKGFYNLEANSKILIKNLGENPIKLKCQLKQSKKKLDNLFIEMHKLKQNNLKISEDIDFNPNAPYSFSNPLFFSVSATCDISAPGPEAFYGKVTKGSASINGNNIPPEGLNLTVNNGDKFSLSASRYSAAEITNQGNAPVHAHCDVGVSNEVFEEKFNELLNIRKSLEEHEKFFHADDFKSLKFLSE